MNWSTHNEYCSGEIGWYNNNFLNDYDGLDEEDLVELGEMFNDDVIDDVKKGTFRIMYLN